MQEKGQKCKNSDTNLYTKKQAVIACLSIFLLKFLISNVLFPYKECTYTFNKDGSASRVSNAWGTKTEFPKDTFVYNGKETPLEMVNEFNSYSNYKNKLDLQA